MAPICRIWAVAVVFLGGSAALGWQGAGERTKVYYLSSREFEIPFDLGTSGRVPAEVQLDYSLDGGNQWNYFAKQATSRTKRGQQSFAFRAHSDGVYLFRLTSIDDFGNIIPTDGSPMAIVVDTEQPTAEMEILLDSSGRVIAGFTITDSYPDVNSLQLEFADENAQHWNRAEIQLTERQGNRVRGQATLEVPLQSRRIIVRLSGADRSGNSFEILRTPELPRVANRNGVHFASQKQEPAKGSVQYLPPPSPPELFLFPSDGKNSGSGANRVETRPSDSSHSPSQLDRDGKYVLQQMPEATTHAGEGYLPRPSNTNAAPASVRDQPSSPLPELPFRVEPFYSRSRAFSLDYAIEDELQATVSAIELWGTVDRGRTWEYWDKDPDRQSPFDIQVDEDGLFGFRMVITTNQGISGNNPQPGDEADVWVQVDTVPPSARISSAMYGRGAETGCLVIEYECSDEWFGKKPIQLSFSENPQGPWSTIAAGLSNQGRYAWRADPNLPKKIYLRIDAVDLAGNTGTFVTDIPVDMQGLAPRGRFQGVRPIDIPR